VVQLHRPARVLGELGDFVVGELGGPGSARHTGHLGGGHRLLAHDGIVAAKNVLSVLARPKREACGATHTIKNVLRMQIAVYDRLDTYGRYLAEKALRAALARQRRKQEGESTLPDLIQHWND